MKKNGVKSETILEVDAVEVIEEVDHTEALALAIDKKFAADLAKQKIEDKVIDHLQEKYGSLRLRDLNDKENYLAIREARKIVRRVGTTAEKICEAGRKDAILEQKLWIAKQKEYLARIDKIQGPLDAELKRYDDEQERIEMEQRLAEEARFEQRKTRVIQMGGSILNNHLVLGTAMYELAVVKSSDDEVWNELIFQKYKAQFEAIASEKAAEEKRRKEEQEQLAKQQEELRLQREAMEQQRRELEQQQKEMQEQLRKQQEAFDAQKREMAEMQRKQEEEIRLKKLEESNRIISKRSSQLEALGMTYDRHEKAYRHTAVNVDMMTISTATDDDWNDRFEIVKAAIKEADTLDEIMKLGAHRNMRLATINASGAEQEGLGRMSNEAFEAYFADCKVAYDQVIERRAQEFLKQQQAIKEAQAAAELAQAGDKQKWQVFVNALLELPRTEMKSKVYQRKVTIAFEKIGEIINL